SYLVTNLPAWAERLETESLFPAASLEEVMRLYGLRMWIEQSYKHVKHALGWSHYQVRSDKAIRRHWQVVCCAFSFCWYHLSHPTSCATQVIAEQPESSTTPPTSASAETAETGEKNQQGTRDASTRVLAGGPASGPRMARALDHAAALLERLVLTAPASCRATPPSMA
ncbi:MAG TPA: hypothetical protein VHZ51_14160, partial [Ktedonobacteraceae bacterium]|nr:hypothetical protein [Ktedonobacteraceae bacterium]